ncbi:MAG: S9 family peptidase [Bacteroidales bacterium]|nr:S9 family peptidase [Bacteroidales bacterium]
MNIRINSNYTFQILSGALLIAFFFKGILIFGQRSLQHSDYARWNTISEWQISNRGNYAAWVQEPGRGDKHLFIKDLNNDIIKHFPRCSGMAFCGDESILAAKTHPSFDTLRNLKLKGRKENYLPKDSLLIFNLSKNKKLAYKGLKEFKAQSKGSLVAALLEPQKLTDSITLENKSKKKGRLNDLLIYTSNWDSARRYSSVTEFALPDSIPLMVWVRKSDRQDSSFLMVLQKTANSPYVAHAQKGKITDLAIDEQGIYVAFLSSSDTGRKVRYAAFIINLINNQKILVADSLFKGKKEFWLNDKFQPWFSKSGEKLFLGYYQPLPEKSKDTLLPEEKPMLDIWSWTDPLLQPHQHKKLEKDRNKAFLLMYSLKENVLFEAGNDSIENVETYMNGNSNFALGYNYKPYQALQSWDDTYYDVYLIDFHNKKHKLLLQKHNTDAALSPDGQYFIWYDPAQRQWYVRNLKSDQKRCLTCNVVDVFHNADHDVPSLPPSYGYAGWTTGNHRVLIYSEYDIWAFDPEGKVQPQNLTSNWRQARKVRLRYIKENPDLNYISEQAPMLLYAFDKDNKASGYLRLTNFMNRPVPDSLLVGPFRLSEPLKARYASRYLFRKETFGEFPDIWACGESFRDTAKISNANPWLKEYKWGKVQLVSWNSLQGEKLEGLLYTPDDFSPLKKYPMIVYFYERNSDELHRFILPRPSRSIINQSYLVSNDYLVFVPDITYGTGNPGQDAYDCVVSGVNSLIEKGFVDEKHMGIQGQSWGGYQTAFIITRTNMFACAMAGAPVSNMTSAYGGIRWESGMSRMFQYEKSQSRIGGTLWEKPLNYINNSPVFFADRINTPLLMMSNDQDGAVPWYQGIELFTAMRRLGKPCWMLVYNGEEHNLKLNSWGNRMDLTQRMYQFFDHYLKNKPAPRWMTEGIPASLKGINLGY